MKACLTAALVLVASVVMASPSMAEVPEAKQTEPGLYVTAKEAHAMWEADPENVMILDVRTTEEFIYVGHAPMAWNIPFLVQAYEWNSEQRLPMNPNPEFVAQVLAVADPSDTILVVCRSGGRSAKAVDQLAEAGFTHAYTIVDGMEGDKVSDPGSVYQGYRMKNGWKNSGLPLSYDLVPDRMVLPSQ